MTRIIMCGCNGAMGRTISRIVADDPDAEIVAGIDIEPKFATGEYPVYKDLSECKEEADALIDFSSPKALDGILSYCKETKVPGVLCTTGYSEEQLAKIEEASKEAAFLRSANMSLGVNTIMDLIRKATQVLAPEGFDIEIVEKHHNKKADAPSGTALALADSINEVADPPYDYIFDRSQRRAPREKKELGISAVRGGTIVGDHDVIFAGEDEVITISHRAYSKAVFGKGAVSAAKYMKGKGAGMYNMSDVIQG